jgi:hypothetical protein
LAGNPTPEVCQNSGVEYLVMVEPTGLSFRESKGPVPAKIPASLEKQLSSDHARGVRYVFEDNDGWIVLFDHGEFGGGMEWYPRAGGAPRPFSVGSSREGWSPQNVNRAMPIGRDLFLLQGLSHLSLSAGQMARVWREHDHFTSGVIARFSSEPFDWIREGDGTWLVATQDGLWRANPASHTVELVARFPEFLIYPTSLVRTADGLFYVGGRNGVLRLTPTWPDMPRYFAEWLQPVDQDGCRRRR